MNNPTDQNFSAGNSPVQSANPQPGALQDLSAKQSGFISQFVNGSNQTQPVQTMQDSVSKSGMGTPANPVPNTPAPVQANMQDKTIASQDSLPPLSGNVLDINSGNFVVGSTPDTNQSSDSVPNVDTTMPISQFDQTTGSSMPVNGSMQPYQQMPQPQSPVPQPQKFDPNPSNQQVYEPQITAKQQVHSEPGIPNQSLQSTPTIDNNQLNVSAEPVHTMPVPTEAVPVLEQPTPNVSQDENPVIGTHQVAVNEDYADSYSNYYQQQSTPQYGAKVVDPRGIDFSRPSTVASVNQTFADAPQLSDDGYTSTGLLSGFDDSNNSMLPMVSDDDEEDLSDNDAHDNLTPYGFSDFDPNEQMTHIADVNTVDAQGLQEVAEDIDVDFSENLHKNMSPNQSVGVLTQDPDDGQKAILEPKVQQIFSPSSQIEPQASDPHYVQNKYTQVEPQIDPIINQAPSQNSAELSPAARLNQLLEAEEEAEKVIIQKQDQFLKKSSQPKTIKSEKDSIFQQLDPDGSLKGDIRSGMASSKAGGRYFLIISLVVLISVIGFLLVLLGLTLI